MPPVASATGKAFFDFYRLNIFAQPDCLCFATIRPWIYRYKDMKKKYYDEDEIWDEIDGFYEENADTTLRETIDTTGYEEPSEDDDEVFDKDALTYGEDDHPEYVRSLTYDLIDEKGNRIKNELVGRLDMEDGTYVLMHPIDSPDPALLNIFRAWEDPNEGLQLEGISDPDEFARVAAFAEKVLYDDPEATDIPGGGIQWSD